MTAPRLDPEIAAAVARWENEGGRCKTPPLVEQHATAVVADIIATHHDHVWARLPFLPPMAARIERERGSRGGALKRLLVDLHALLFDHLDREDRVLLSIAQGSSGLEISRRAARLRTEHDTVRDLLARIRNEVGDEFLPRGDAGPAERALCAELSELDAHLREQIRLEDALIARAAA